MLSLTLLTGDRETGQKPAQFHTRGTLAVIIFYMTEVQEIVNRIFSIGNETSAPIIITLFIFIVGILINYLINLIEKIIKRKSNRNLFRELLKEISKTTLKQADIFKEFSETLTVDYEDTFILKRENINHLSNLNKLSFDTIHESFFTGIENYFYFRHNREEFNRVWSGISNLTYWENYYRNDLNLFIDKFNNYENKRNDVLGSYNKSFASYILDIKDSDKSVRIKEYIDEYLETAEKYEKVSNRSHYHKAHIHLVKPLLNLNQKFIDISFCLALKNHLIEMSFYYENLEKLLKVYQNLFMNYYSVYRKIGLAIDDYL